MDAGPATPPAATATRRPRWRRRGAVAAGLVAALTVWRLLWPGWPATDGDLRVSPPAPVPDEQNAFAALQAAGQALKLTDQEFFLVQDALSEAGPNPARVTAIVAANAEALRRFAAAVARPHFQVPPVPDSLTPLPYLDAWQALGRLAACQARQHDASGAPQAALDQRVALLRFGRRLQDAGGPVSHVLLGVQLQRLAAEELLRALPSLNLPPTALAAAVRRLADGQANPAGQRQACRAEYALWCADLDLIAAGRYTANYANIPSVLVWHDWPRFGIQRQTTRRLYADFWRFTLAELERPAAQRRTWDAGPRAGPLTAWRRLADPNHCGRQLAVELSRQFAALPRRAARNELEVRLCQTVLALHGYARQHGELPAALAQLVPDWLPAPPATGFSDAPLGYQPAARLLFTPGADGQAPSGPPRPLPVDAAFTFGRFWQRENPGLTLPP